MSIQINTPAIDLSGLTPAECIRTMFAHTNEQGRLCIPEWPLDVVSEETTRVFDCLMNWDEAACKSVIADCERQIAKLKAIAAMGLFSENDPKKVPEEVLSVWKTYCGDLRPDEEKRVLTIAERLANDDPVSEEDKAFHDKYYDWLYEEGVRRFGNRPAAYGVFIRGRRLCHLFALKAPEILAANEANLFAQAMAINTCCTSLTVVDW